MAAATAGALGKRPREIPCADNMAQGILEGEKEFSIC